MTTNAGTKVARLTLLTLRGTPVLYQGDEIGLGDVAVAVNSSVTRSASSTGPCALAARDAHTDALARRARRRLHRAGVVPWLPLGDTAPATSPISARIPARCSTFTRDLIAFRKAARRVYVPAPTRCVARRMACGCGRAVAFVVVLNLSESDADLDDMTGRIQLATDRARDGEALSGSLRLRGVGRRGGRTLIRGLRGDSDEARISAQPPSWGDAHHVVGVTHRGRDVRRPGPRTLPAASRSSHVVRTVADRENVLRIEAGAGAERRAHHSTSTARSV